MPCSGWLDRLFPSPAWDEVVFWALDLETTGLKPSADRILSIGMVPIRGGIIRYGERYATLVRPSAGEGLSTEGLPAHHILPAETVGAPSIDRVLPEIDARLREGVLLLHFKALDLAFLREAHRRSGTSWPRPRVVDTVDLLLRLHDRQQQWTPHPPAPATGLAAARERLGLPAYPSHDALCDALATAELFLVLRSRLGLCTLRSLHR